MKRLTVLAIAVALAVFTAGAVAQASPAKPDSKDETTAKAKLTVLSEKEAAKARAWAERRGIDVPAAPSEGTFQGQNTVYGNCGSASLFLRDVGRRLGKITIAAYSSKGPIAAYAWRFTIFNSRWSRARIGSGTEGDPFFYDSVNQRVPTRGYYIATLQRLYVFLGNGKVCAGLRPFDGARIT